MVTPADSDGNGGSTSQDRQDDMQQGNELMEICLFPCLSVIQTETRYVQPGTMPNHSINNYQRYP